MKNKFSFYEVVIIDSDLLLHKEINQCKGVIVGMSYDEMDDTWGYAVSIDNIDDGWSLEEMYLRPTGEFRKREDIMSDDSISVIVKQNDIKK